MLPDKWITNYENIHTKTETVQSKIPFFVRKKDGSVETRFIPEKDPDESSSSSSSFPTMDQLMFQPVNPLEVQVLTQDKIKKHQIVDCTCDECKADSVEVELELEAERKLYPKKRKGKKSPQQLLQERYEAGDPEVGLLGDPSEKFDYYVLYLKKKTPFNDALPPDDWGKKPPSPKPKPPPSTLQPYYQKALSLLQKPFPQPCKPISFPLNTPSPIECFMFQTGTSQYQEQFPHLEDFEHPQQRVRHQWKIKTPSVKNADGTNRQVSPTEATLNWQAENAVAQNQVMRKILKGQ